MSRNVYQYLFFKIGLDDDISNPMIINYIDIHLEIEYTCTLQNIMDKPFQSGK